MRHYLLLILTTIVSINFADADWTMYRADVRRSGVVTSDLRLPLKSGWELRGPAPEQAWTGPAKWDAYSGNSGLQSMRNFDPCYYVTGQDGLIFYGSSADNAVHCIDAATGKEKWVFFTDAAVRQPPALYQGLALAGSDDGYVYAIRIADGSLAWKLLAAPVDRRIPSNGKLISMWPVRSGVTLVSGKAYFAASLTPWETSILWCVDPLTGKVGSAGTWRKELKGVTLQGACLAGDGKLFCPQGRSTPLIYDLTNGNPLGSIGHAGGVFCLLDDAGRLLAGPQNQRSKDEQIRVIDPVSKRHLVTFGSASRVVIAGDLACVQNGQKLRCFDYRKHNEIRQKQSTLLGEVKPLQKKLAELRKQAAQDKKEETLAQVAELEKQIAAMHAEANAEVKGLPGCEKWLIDFPQPHDLIVAGTSLIAGLDNEVRVIDIDSGKTQWSAKVNGRAMGLAVIQGQLYVSTDRGTIHSFKN